MPIEIRRFGVGHRRPGGPIGSVGLSGQVIHSDGRGNVSELAFARNARTEPHANPNTTLFIVVEGGGWVGVGGERTRIAAGEAAVWPADIPTRPGPSTPRCARSSSSSPAPTTATWSSGRAREAAERGAARRCAAAIRRAGARPRPVGRWRSERGRAGLTAGPR